MGMLFLVLTPALYCDVTDSWLLPSKWKRIWISAAGIYVECFLRQHRHVRLVEHRAGAAQQPDAGDHVHLLGEHDPVQRQPAAPVRRLLRDGRLAGDPQPPDQEHPVLRLPVPGEGAGAGSSGAELHAPVAADPVRHLRDRELSVSLGRDVQHHVLPQPVPQAVQARDRSATCWRSGSLVPLVGHAALPDGQVRSHAWEDAKGEEGTSGRASRWRRSPSSPGSC